MFGVRVLRAGAKERELGADGWETAMRVQRLGQIKRQRKGRVRELKREKRGREKKNKHWAKRNARGT